MPNPLYVSFVWHLHQPFYKDTETGEYFLPWVRLHAVKDYLHLAEILRDYPTIHQTINVVPSLLVQLQDYADGRATDPSLAVSQKRSLTPVDKKLLLDRFFSINWDRFVWPVPRYAQLARLREAANGDVDLLGDRFWLDLIVWFNLAWVDPSARRRDPRLAALVSKGGSYDHDDVASVLAYHREACAKIIPAYRELAERGQIEISTTPFFHPIAPLLIDTASAQQARRDVTLPDARYRHVEDAREQLDRALGFHARVFGRAPRGIWPAEGAVSQGLLDLTREYPGLSWLATDEHLLERALNRRFERDGYGHLTDPAALCQPYRVAGHPTVVFFRDQTLSDKIGFAYQHLDSATAADDLVDRLLNVWQKVNADAQPRVISIILDGENCWESYPNNGDDFLRGLFDRLGREPRLPTITPAEYLDRFGATRTLDRLPAGSWIGANFDTWIGEPSQNRAWDLLAAVRDDLSQWEHDNHLVDRVAAESDDLLERQTRARLALLVAQGSDWFWWYYSHNRFGNERAFDGAFRRHLSNVYRAIGAPPPRWLQVPIDASGAPKRRGFTGELSVSHLSSGPVASEEWASAGLVEPETSTGAMQAGRSVFRRLYFGCDRHRAYARIETTGSLRDDEIALYVGADGSAPGIVAPTASPGVNGSGPPGTFQLKLVLAPDGDPARRVFRAAQGGTWEQTSEKLEAAFGESVVEVAIERAAVGVGPTAEVRMQAVARGESGILETLPTKGPASARLTGNDVGRQPSSGDPAVPIDEGGAQ
ncbi:MAG: hypothetical protein ACRDIY_09895 [Chloroflexota bacterium]